MAVTFTLKDIDEALFHLQLNNENTLKYKFVKAIRMRYENDELLDAPRALDPNRLIEILWTDNTYTNKDLIKNKKKQLSSLKSSINNDLKKLCQNGKNPHGIIIGQNFLFEMSNEAKDRALSSVAEILKARDPHAIGKITDIIKQISNFLSEGKGLDLKGIEAEGLGELKGLVEKLFKKLDTPGDSICTESKEKECGTENKSAGLTTDVIDDIFVELEDVSEVVVEPLIKDTEDVTDDIIDEAFEEDFSEELEIEDTVESIEEGVIEESEEEVYLKESFDGRFARGKDSATVDGEESSVFDAGSTVAKIIDEKLLQDTEDGFVESFLQDAVEEIMEEEFLANTASDGYLEGKEDDKRDYPLLDKEENMFLTVDDEETIIAEETSEADTVEEHSGGILVEEIVNESEQVMTASEGSFDEIHADFVEVVRKLEMIGLDFEDEVVLDEDIRKKAQILSDAFDRYLSFRDRFYNQHVYIRSDYIKRKECEENVKHEANMTKVPSFYIGKFPVTNSLFEIFVEKTGYRTTAERLGYGLVYIPRFKIIKDLQTSAESFIFNSCLKQQKVEKACWYQPSGSGSSIIGKKYHPVVQVSLEDARAFAAWTGKRIPSEEEWEIAACGNRGYRFPWGNEWRKNACNIESSMYGDTTPVDKYIENANEFGVVDMLGNVLEWTLNIWEEKNKNVFVVRGGSWASDSSICLGDRFPMHKNFTSNILGFRCVAI